MVILIGGASHTGKTLLAQKLMEKYRIPYFSIDHLKMGIIKSQPGCGFIAESADEIITEKLWPMLRAMIMTIIENSQNIIIEGCYLPYSIKELEDRYPEKIIYFKIGFSEDYIKNNYRENIIGNESVIEKREGNFHFPPEKYIEENKKTKELCCKNNVNYFEIKNNYNEELNGVFNWIDTEAKRIAYNKDMYDAVL